jgi:hypothetical protein
VGLHASEWAEHFGSHETEAFNGLSVEVFRPLLSLLLGTNRALKGLPLARKSRTGEVARVPWFIRNQPRSPYGVHNVTPT